jgi:hypothetical protein
MHGAAGSEEQVAKSIGGDEVYISLVHKKKKEFSILAVGHTRDMNDGRYEINFQQLVKVDTACKFCQFQLILQYSCGNGAMAPPSKLRWTTGMSLGTSMMLEIPTSVPFHFAKPDTSQPLVLKWFDHVHGLGDSLMEQLFVKSCDVKGCHGTNVSYEKIASALTSSSSPNLFQKIVERVETLKGKRILLVLGSGVWDLLEATPYQFFLRFEDHLSAMSKLLSRVQKRYPNISLAWKGMTAVHVHKVSCSGKWCIDRIKYMSSSRSALLDELQQKLLAQRHPNVTVLKLYDLTYNAAHLAKPNDGRHYIPEMCKQMWHAAFEI